MTKWDELGDADERANASFMRRVASLPAPAALPDPSVIWWKAQLVRRWEAQRRAQLPLDVMQPIEIVGGMAVAAVLLFLVAPYLL
jgi:hypothetical protein